MNFLTIKPAVSIFAYRLLALSMAGSACLLRILSDTRTADSSSEIPPHKMASRKDFPIWPTNSVPSRPHCRRSPHPLLPSAGREPAFPAGSCMPCHPVHNGRIPFGSMDSPDPGIHRNDPPESPVRPNCLSSPYILPEVREGGPVLLPDAAEYPQTRCSRIPSCGFSDPKAH